MTKYKSIEKAKRIAKDDLKLLVRTITRENSFRYEKKCWNCKRTIKYSGSDIIEIIETHSAFREMSMREYPQFVFKHRYVIRCRHKDCCWENYLYEYDQGYPFDKDPAFRPPIPKNECKMCHKEVSKEDYGTKGYRCSYCGCTKFGEFYDQSAFEKYKEPEWMKELEEIIYD